MYNITQICQGSPGTFILQAHEQTAMPSLIILFAAMALILALGGWFLGGKSKKFWTIYVLFMVLGGIITVALINMPESVQFVASLVGLQ